MKKTRAAPARRPGGARPGKPASNPRAPAQTRKVMGRHYAAKYRTGRG